MNFDIRRYEEVASTNTLAKAFAEQGAPEGLVLVAEHQTAGRGKLSNRWLSPAGKNLLFSLLVRPNLDPAAAPIVTQVACRSVSAVLGFEYGIESTFKRPNDILVNGRKICGILVEAASRSSGKLDYAIIGVGLNVNASPKELGHQAVSMREITGNEYDREILLSQVLAKLADDLGVLSHHPS